MGDFQHSACGRTANRKYKQYPVGMRSVVELIGVLLLCRGGAKLFSNHKGSLLRRQSGALLIHTVGFDDWDNLWSIHCTRCMA